MHARRGRRRGGAGPRLRVIAGEAAGRRLVAPPAARPTTDRVRAAVFSALGERVRDAAVLDLYAGSGALGLEALSRGAARALLVDDDPAALDALRANLTATGLTGRARVEEGTVARLLEAPPPAEAPFDLVLVDPPYEAAASEVPAVLEAIGRPGWLGARARVVLETPARAAPPEPGPRFAVGSRRRYGDTLVTTLDPALGP